MPLGPRKGTPWPSGRKRRMIGKEPRLRRLEPIRKTEKVPGRNAQCPCGSGQKFKRCCGRNMAWNCSTPPLRVNPYSTLADLYTPEQEAAATAFIKQWGFTPNPSQLMGYMAGDHEELQAAILRGMQAINAKPHFFYAVEKLGRLITPKNQRLVSKEEGDEWEAAIAEFKEKEECQSTTKSESTRSSNDLDHAGDA